MPAAALAVPAAIGIGGSIIGGIKGSKSANAAAKTQAHWGEAVGNSIEQAGSNAQGAMNSAVGQANTTLGDVFSQQKDVLNPYLTAGQQSVTTLSDVLNGDTLKKEFAFDPSQIEQDKGYQFMLAEGQKALERSAAARGGALGGAALKGMTRYAQGMASTEFNNAYNRAADTFKINRDSALSRISGLTSLAGIGQNATGQFNQAAMNYGNTTSGNLLSGAQYSGDVGLRATALAGDAYLGGANAKAAGQLASGNIWSNTIGSVANTAADYAAGKSYGGNPTTNLSGYLGQIGAAPSFVPDNSRGIAVDNVLANYMKQIGAR